MNEDLIKRNPSVLMWAGLFAGLFAGALTIVVPLLVSHLGSPFYIGALFGIFLGDIFGVVISVYFWFVLRTRSIARTIGFVLASTFAYILAMYTTIFASGLIGFSPSTAAAKGSLSTAPVLAFFLGGTVGGFAILFAALLWFSAENRLSRVFLKALQWSVAGGILGALGWAMGPLLGGIAVSAVGQRAVLSSPGDAGTDYYYSLFLVWQTGMGLLLGVVFSREQAGVTSHANSICPSRTGSRQITRIARICFVAVSALVLAYFARREFPEHYQSTRWHRALAEHHAEMPSLDNLQKVEAVPADQVLILNPMGEYVPGRTYVGESHPVLDAKTGRPTAPTSQCYVIRYRLPGAPDNGPRIGPHVDVQVQEYPTAAWAKYQLGEQGFATNLADIEKPTKFGNRILAQTKFANQGAPAYYSWASGNRLVILQFFSVEPDEFLKQYLGKYPSSL